MCCWLNGQYIYWNKSLVRVPPSIQDIYRHKWGTRWRRCLRHWDFSKTWSCVVDWASKRNDGHGCLPRGKDGRCVRLTYLLSSRADCLEILGASTFWNTQALFRPRQACVCTYRHWRVEAVKVHLGYGYTTAQWNYTLLRELRPSGLLRSK